MQAHAVHRRVVIFSLLALKGQLNRLGIDKRDDHAKIDIALVLGLHGSDLGGVKVADSALNALAVFGVFFGTVRQQS